MTKKKLSLSDFLTSSDSCSPIEEENNAVNTFTYPIVEFSKLLSEYTGSFLVNKVPYTDVIVSDYSIYFYEGEKLPILFMYTSIIDIKKRENTCVLFFDDHMPIALELI